MSDPMCDWCGERVHLDGNGWWVGADDASDCPEHEQGHNVNGQARG
jgi:hypothetical protein